MTDFTTRIDAEFAELKAQGKKAFVSYVMAGDPNYETSLEVVKGLPAAGRLSRSDAPAARLSSPGLRFGLAA